MDYKQRGDAETWLMVAICTLIGLLFVVPISLFVFKDLFTQRQEIITINKTERITERQSSRYLIYAKEGVYENTDTLLLGKFNSSDLYNQLQANKTYNCLVAGWRNGFFSWYPNVIKCEEIKK